MVGWLRLTTRGVWLIGDAPVEHPALRAHLNRHYFRDAEGRYCVQNGAQVVFVRLDYAPYVLHLAPTGDLVAHTGELAGAVHAACLDEQGALTRRASRAGSALTRCIIIHNNNKYKYEI